MALADLAPWPTTPAASAAALACLAAAIGVTDEDNLDRLGAAAAALVERYAPDAPIAIKNEAVVRTAGWLAQQPAAAVRRESVGDISTSWSPALASALRHSGAMALLSPWKIRRAGAIA